jgi:small subunit ribosomal protein S1
MPYGAFIELVPGVEGLVHVSELSWSRVAHAEGAVRPGDEVPVKVIAVEGGGEGKRPKIALSIKQTEPDPWLAVGERVRVGEKVKGEVTRLMPFGAFVEISPGIEGLVHISEMSYTRRVHKPEELLAPGETVAVMVKRIEADRRRIALSIKEAEGDPWLDVSRKYTPGQTVQGTVSRREAYGLFIDLEPGVTGLLPRSKVVRSVEGERLEKARPGQSIAVRVAEVHPGERRITLAPPEEGSGDDWRRFAGGTQSAASELGEKLKAALAAKK